MPVNVIYDPTSDANFRRRYGRAFYEWMNTVGNNTTSDGSVVFDEAYVLNGLHPTTSRADSNPEPHATIRLSNAALRQQRRWYVLHWRPNGGSLVQARPDLEESVIHRRQKQKQKQKQKKKRRRERKQMEKGKKDGPDGRGRGGGRAPIT